MQTTIGRERRIVRMRVAHNGRQYLGECLEYPVMTHGASLEDLAENMRKALELFMQEEGGLSEEENAVIVTLDLEAGGGWSGDLA